MSRVNLHFVLPSLALVNAYSIHSLLWIIPGVHWKPLVKELAAFPRKHRTAILLSLGVTWLLASLKILGKFNFHVVHLEFMRNSHVPATANGEFILISPQYFLSSLLGNAFPITKASHRPLWHSEQTYRFLEKFSGFGLAQFLSLMLCLVS